MKLPAMTDKGVMEKVVKYKETIIFASCATALVGTVLLLQKVTTPSQHRRAHAGSSASRAGPRSRSASHGAVGPRSRSSSRLRGNHPHQKENTINVTTSSINPVTSAAAGVAGGTGGGGGGDRGRGSTALPPSSRSRDASQVHAHRHHSHPRPTTADGTSGAVSSGREKKVAEVLKKPLTVEAVAQHTKALGTANALHSLGASADVTEPALSAAAAAAAAAGNRIGTTTTAAAPPQRGGRSGGGGTDEGGNYRSASNAATVGSQAIFGASTNSPTAGSATQPSAPPTRADVATAEEKAGLPPRSPRMEEPAAVQVAATAQARVQSKTKPQSATSAEKARPTPVNTCETQTSVRWFCNDHGTQTEPMDVAARPPTTSVTPERWTRAAMMSPILPSGGRGANESSVLQYADFGWTPVQDVDHTQPMNTAGSTLTPHGNGAVATCKAALVPVPSYFLSKLEAQVRQLVHLIDEDEANEKAWMQLYVYLSELPLTVRKALAERDCCGVTSAFISRAITAAEGRMHLHVAEGEVEGRKDGIGAASEPAPDATTAEVTASSPSSSSLPLEVLHLLQDGTPQAATVHYEWREHACVRVDGPFVARSATAPNGKESNKEENAKWARSTRFAHVQLSPITSTSSSASSSAASSSGEKCSDREDNNGPMSDVVFVAKHIEKYSSLLPRLRAVSAPSLAAFEAAAAASDVLGQIAVPSRDDQTPTRRSYDNPQQLSEAASANAAAAAVQQLQFHQQQLASFLAAFVQLKQSESFQAMRQSSQFAPFACDFIELTSSAQHFLDLGAVSPDASQQQLLLQMPSTQKRLISSDATDPRDTSIGTTTSVRSDSSPTSGAVNRMRRAVKPRTPMKPSIRYPVHRATSSSPSPASGSPGV